jgi:hypothetical protein
VLVGGVVSAQICWTNSPYWICGCDVCW